MASSADPTIPASKKSRVIYAPRPFTPQGQSVFLAGTIHQGDATWQKEVIEKMSHLPVTILNPHRLDWDSSWVQDISCQPLRKQITWELDMLEGADVIALYFDPDKPAPISLLELGLFARSGKIIVACPEGFYRRGNVQIVCQRFEVELVNNLEELVEGIVRRLGRLEA